jgi:single-strand DNA-binding protein
MNNLNSVLIEGNLVRDPVFKETPEGTKFCALSIASSRFYKGEGGMEKEVGFFDIETYGKLAESCHDLGHKGRGLRTVGRIRQDRWTGEKGEPQSRIVVVAEHVEFRPEFAPHKSNDADNQDYEAVANQAVATA